MVFVSISSSLMAVVLVAVVAAVVSAAVSVAIVVAMAKFRHGHHTQVHGSKWWEELRRTIMVKGVGRCGNGSFAIIGNAALFFDLNLNFFHHHYWNMLEHVAVRLEVYFREQLKMNPFQFNSEHGSMVS